MPLKFQDRDVLRLYLGDQPVARAYFGDELLFQDEAPLVFVLWGQSNIKGNAPIAELPAYLDGPLTDVDIWTGSAWAPLEADVNNNYPIPATDWGPEMMLGFLAAAYSGKKVYIIKHGQPAPLIPTTGNNWNVNGGDEFDLAVTEMQQALSNLRGQGLSPDIVGLWGQGKSDSGSTGVQTAYRDAQMALFNAWRSAAGESDMPILDLRVGNDNDPGSFPGIAEVNAAKDEVTANLANVQQIKALGMNDIGDGNHFNGASQLAFGRHTFEIGRGLTYPLPAGLSTPVAWFDASRQENVTFGSYLKASELRDSSGAGKHFTQATAGNRPGFYEGVLSRGFGAARFGSGLYAATTGQTVTIGDAFTVVLLISNFTNPTASNFRTVMTGVSSGFFAAAFPSGSGKIGFNLSGRIIEAPTDMASGQTYMVVMSYAGAAGNYIDINGIEVAANTTASSHGTTSELGLNILNGNSNGQYDLSVAGLFNGSFTPTQRQIMAGYLAHRFSLTDLLPAGHAYKTEPPSPLL